MIDREFLTCIKMHAASDYFTHSYVSEEWRGHYNFIIYGNKEVVTLSLHLFGECAAKHPDGNIEEKFPQSEDGKKEMIKRAAKILEFLSEIRENKAK